jgi:hypothetical protein
MARNLTPRAHLGSTLNFHEATDPCLIADLATIQVHETEKPDSCTKADV